MSENLYYELNGKPKIATSYSVQIAREIGLRIISGDFEAGALIDDEGALSSQFDVSRTVIRDAVKLLSAKGMLEVRRGIGTRVRFRSSWDLLDDDVLAWHQSVPPSAAFLRQLLELRLMIEPTAARLAAQRGDDEALAEISNALAQMEAEQGEVERFVVADAIFHRAILRASQNELLRPIEGVIYSSLLLSVRLTNKDPRENDMSMPFHRDICAAILNQNSELAECKMDAHLRDTQERLGRYMNDS
ncbi:GntR family transcriptional regulator [Rhodobacteraceae bacterium (ex Bugula neritina AB1)]|nr:GntR family transcriptional regulator [Rhodobacteraceae bacterium (ex Bugula neritina AB1)]